jgi:hypothetical protein
MRFVGRWLGLFTIAWFTAGAVASCGSGNNSSNFVAGDDGSADGANGDSSMGGHEGGTFGGDATTDGGSGCKTCKDQGYTCGKNGDGCGNVIDCGSCAYPEYCGGGGFSKCGGNLGVSQDGGPICAPTTCAQLGYTCGMAGDGCGHTLDCGTCTNPEYCGGGGFSKCGGNNGLNLDGGVMCTAKTCAQLGYDCGMAGDQCGGILNCGSCTNPQFCGGNGPGKCGGNNGLGQDGGTICNPTQSCGSLGYTCGYADDGCGNLLNCGGTTCPYPQFCGGGGPNKCGGNTGLTPDGAIGCTPISNPCVAAGYTCGYAPDGCGNVVACGTCNNPQYCGGGGPNKCGGNNGLGADGGITCTPTQTCASLGYTCGYGDDGCGNLLNCGGTTCPTGQHCGGGGPNKCGPTTIGTCDGGTTTTLTGYVFDPANNLPVYNALVFVPVGAVQTPQTGVVPAQCGCASQPAYASAFTDITGKFTLSNPPSGTNVTIVVQLGKWQRVFTKSITTCAANSLGGGTAGSAANLTLPSTHLQGNIPRFAIDTGNVDSMECVLLKMGIAQSEFVDPAIAGGVPTAVPRIHMYQGINVAGGAIIDANTPTEDKLTEVASVMDSYDVILFPCQGGRGDYSPTSVVPPGWPNTFTNMANYSAAGGRFFTTHFHYDMLQPNAAFSGTANWTLDNGSWGNLYGDPKWTANINQGFARGVTLSQWLNLAIVYGGTYGQIPVGVVRNDYSSVNGSTLNWLTAAGGGTGGPPAGVPEHFTFDTPFGAAQTCGRVVYSDFHVESEQTNNGTKGVTFPGECPTGAMTPQEKLLEFMLFDLTSCVSPPTCTPLTCNDFPATTCGVQGDGCGGQTAFCHPCPNGQVCGGGGVANQCGAPDAGCVPKTCANFTQCGVQGDGCGGQTAFCNPCPTGQVCGGGGPGVCGAPDAACVPLTCANFTQCGVQGDGCGGQTAFCNPCPTGQACGVGGTGVCGAPDGGTCTALTCANYQGLCGQQSDGCGGLTPDCMCPSGQMCLAGTCGVLDAGACTPRTCSYYPPGTCGQQSDGCGGLTSFCNPCIAPATCGGGGVANMCGYIEAGTCKPLTCAQEGLMCGASGDGCGGLLSCGNCPSGQMCVGGVCKGVQ